MALKSRIRRWLGVPSGAALAEVRDEIARLAGEVVRLTGEGERLSGEVAALRLLGEEQDARHQREAEVLHSDLSALADRFETHASRNYATADDLAELQSRIEGKEAKVEDMRIALAGLTEQLRWESEDLRKGLAAIVERAERQRRQA